MIEYKTGDILSENADALVNTVNCVGFMGRGIALQFKQAWPENFNAYAAACKRHEVQPGRMFIYATGHLTPPRFIVNFPTKRHWRGKSRMEDIESGLKALVEEIRARDIRSIAIPPLGAGLGGLNWSHVRSRIDRALSELPDVRVIVFEPQKDPGSAPNDTVGSAPKMGENATAKLTRNYSDPESRKWWEEAEKAPVNAPRTIVPSSNKNITGEAQATKTSGTNDPATDTESRA